MLGVRIYDMLEVFRLFISRNREAPSLKKKKRKISGSRNRDLDIYIRKAKLFPEDPSC